ncbi:MAG: LAGLIDADG family homing endonuclease [Acidimicrobiia bacterium]
MVKNKCVAAGTRVFDPATGLTHRVEELMNDDVGTAVAATDKTGRMHHRPIVRRMNQGVQATIGLRLRDGTVLRLTPDHRVLTARGWQKAGELTTDDRVARPRRIGTFGESRPVPPEHARLLGYLIGDGYVGGKTPISFINIQESLHDDVRSIANDLGCSVRRRGIEASISHRPGERNGVLELARWAGIWGHLAPEKKAPAAFFAPDIAEDVVANLLFGLWESDGYVSREQTGGVRCGYTTTSEQLAHQVHWLLLRFGIWSSVRSYDPTAQRPSIIEGRRVQSTRPAWEVRVSGIDNVTRLAEVLPLWGPRGRVLGASLADPSLAVHRGSQTNYLAPAQTEPVIAYLKGAGVTPSLAAQLVGDSAGDPRGGFPQVLGVSRLRRDRIVRLADALDSQFLRDVVSEELWYDRIHEIEPAEQRPTYDLEVEEFHNFVADGVVVHNCAAPFRQAEFDIMYGKGISREGALLDIAVDLDIVKKSGAWFTYEGEQLGQGREKVKAFLAENLDLMVEITEKVRQASGIDDEQAGDVDLDAEADGESATADAEVSE